MKLDILVFAAHPDDMELACSGTVAKHLAMGKKVGVVDLTQGELGTRGNAKLRLEEAEQSAKLLGLDYRNNLGMKDGLFEIDAFNLGQVAEQIRFCKPEVVLANAVSDRHPDHGRGAALVSRACFLSGLKKFETVFGGDAQEAWRPKAVYHYIQDRYIKPDFVVDISEHWELKKKSILAFSSQFYNPDSQEAETPISSSAFLDFLEARAREFGRPAGYQFAEGFTVERLAGVKDILALD